MKQLLLFTIAALLPICASGQKTVKVFIALCDNKTQGIVPVGARIGDGDVPDANLYWGCSDGVGAYFKKSKSWKTVESKSDVTNEILRRIVLRHADGDLELVAEAYRGSNIQLCMENFQKAAASGAHDLVAYIGHNGLMEFELPKLEPDPNNKTETIVLCCISDKYFSTRLEELGCRPILMTTQLMYPGAFILHDVINAWKEGASPTAIQDAAAKAYAKNQEISVKAARGIFTASESSK